VRTDGTLGRGVPCALDSARRRLRRARASARLVSARRRCSGDSEEGEELEEREAAGAAHRRLAGRAKKSAIVLGAAGVGGDGGIGSGFGGFREAAARDFVLVSSHQPTALAFGWGVLGKDVRGIEMDGRAARQRGARMKKESARGGRPMRQAK
jgi:hypothetical protein